MDDEANIEELKTELEHIFHVSFFNAFCRALEIDGNHPMEIAKLLETSLDVVTDALAKKAKLPNPEEFLENMEYGPMDDHEPFCSMSRNSLDRYIEMLEEIKITIKFHEMNKGLLKQRTLCEVSI